MAGRIVRGIGAIGSANVVRGAIALFQRIRHPWKDKIFGTDPTTKKPIYCTHHLCLSGGSQRGSHHGSYRIAQRKPWLFNRKPLKQVTVKIIIDSTNKQISNELKNSEKIESLTQDSSLHLSPAPPSSSLKAYLYHPEQSNTLVGHEQLPYSFHNPWLHYEVGENNHFESFGKQEHGKIETAPVKPKVYYFNPLLHRSRITNYVRNLQQTFNTSHCHLCKRPLDTNHESIKLNNKNIKDDNNDDDDLISRLKNDKLSLLSMRRKWYWANKLRNIRNSLLEQLKPEKHPKHIATYKRTYIDLLLRALTESNALVPILQSPKYLSLIEKLVSSSTGNQMDMLQSSATKKPLLLLPYYKNSKDSEN
ncbi:uncharacterized protein LOC142330528 [Lycorma delicatula]|uniref:uncharacterized protein LOC142330528 n=1 Tax=Lycorma delicatula TaxID=130591 RepID=UPI003F514550